MNHTADMLYLVPGGYPVSIDVAQATIAGAGTAMHFVLPMKGHNLPLMHERETKLLVALQGEMEVRSGGRTLAVLRQGQAVLLHPGVAHRVHQHGAHPSMVGVALWPGAVEEAFRQQAARVVAGDYDRDGMIRLFADYRVTWDAAVDGEPVKAEVRPFDQWLPHLPPDFARELSSRWRMILTVGNNPFT